MIQRQDARLRLIKLSVFISFLFCHLEWGRDNSGFVFQMEYSIIMATVKADTFSHPLILIPLIGQLLLIVSIILPGHKRKLTLTAICMLGVLVLMILLAGILVLNFKIILSTLPFIFSCIFYFVEAKKSKAW